MKNLLLILIVCLICSCQKSSRKSSEPISEKISQYVETNCKESKTCTLNLKEITNFSWDKLYFFSGSVEESDISKVIGKKFSSTSQYYSNKLIFIQNNQIVESEQHIMLEIDEPFHNGDVDFELKDSQNNYIGFNNESKFEVEKIKLNDGEFYRLRCINCE